MPGIRFGCDDAMNNNFVKLVITAARCAIPSTASDRANEYRVTAIECTVDSVNYQNGTVVPPAAKRTLPWPFVVCWCAIAIRRCKAAPRIDARFEGFDAPQRSGRES